MNRVRAESLVLVNWKGVFYRRYELDRHVTALEGDNGAGKTTVMIAAYVVLLPDMSRLRFTNLGETGATGGDKGIWGRLGELGRPAYSAIDFRLPRGERVLAGVHLERKGEPTVEPTPFMVTGLADGVRLQDALLLSDGEIEQVPELGELRENVARLGGHLQVFGSAKDYFAALFDHDITPLRLSTDEERNKLNEMLKTSMTGGMSRGLLQELRSFLLQERGGLAETLQRMRANLDACRRTRTEVIEAQRLEREIGAVYEAGESMFAAAVAATRQRAEEMAAKVEAAEERSREAEESVSAATEALRAAERAVEEAGERRERAARAAAEAERHAEAVERAAQLAREVKERRAEEARLVEEAAAADARRREREDVLARATRRRSEAEEDRERAAAGLADLQAGLEELHRRAAAYRLCLARLADARRLLGVPELGPDELEADAAARREAYLAQALGRLDEERRGLARRLADAAQHRVEHGEALAALERLLGRSLEGDGAAVAGAHALAREALRAAREARELAERRPRLEADLRATRARAAEQARVVEKAHRLGLDWPEGEGRATVLSALRTAEEEVAAREEQARRAVEAAAAAGREAHEGQELIRALTARSATYRALCDRAQRVARALGAELANREDLDGARAELSARVATKRSEVGALEERSEALRLEARRLLDEGGQFPAALLALRDELAADLVAGYFDDVDVEAAGVIEARLGPLAQGLVVADLDEAAALVGGRAAELPSVWLVGEGAALPLAVGGGAEGRGGGSERTAGQDVVVDEGAARRVTRVPEQPTLGRQARERRAEACRREAEALAGAADGARAEEGALREWARDADALLEGSNVWLAGDPSEELAAVRNRQAKAEEASRAARFEQDQQRSVLSTLRPRVAALRALLPDAALLDEADLDARARELAGLVAAAEAAANEVARTRAAVEHLEGHLDVLRLPPMGDAELAAERRRLEQLEGRRDNLAEGLGAFGYAAANRQALGWGDAAARLSEREGLVPSLKAQLEAAAEALERARLEEAGARDAREEAAADWRRSDAAHVVARERLTQAERAFDGTGLADEATDDGLARAREGRERARAESSAAQAELGRRQQGLGAASSRWEAADTAAKRAREVEDDERRQARPATEAWARLDPLVAEAGVLSGAALRRFEELYGSGGFVNLFGEASKARALLLERLRGAHDGGSLLRSLEGAMEAIPSPGQGAGQALTTGESYLRGWLEVRRWLLARLPAQIAEVDEPLEAMRRFREHLDALLGRLERQERDLRGASEDVARGIDVQVRKAHGRVRRLNEHLGGVRFGAIAGIRVRMERVERMEQVLRALRSGEAQGLLFQAELPVEEALDEIFRRFGGGRTGGQKLLDYREYLHLRVEVVRHDSTEWEAANPSKLSTGEAIGVGAALMMVVLIEWERDATMFRGRRSFGSLRFLFLDEANRLDRANLGTVFELCRALDLQLLVAAPEVARAEGCTVFRLVRTRDGEGRESVEVSGRRVTTTPPAPGSVA